MGWRDYMRPMAALRLFLDTTLVSNVCLTYATILLLGILAAGDSYNTYTVPLYQWRAAVLFVGVLLVTSAATWLFLVFRKSETFDAYHERLKTDASARKGDKATGGLLTTPVSAHVPYAPRDQWTRNNNVTVAMVAYSTTLAAMYIFAAVQILSLYYDTSDVDGGQHALDQGFNKTAPLTYPEHIKMQFLDLLRMAAIVGTGLAFVVATVRVLYPATQVKHVVGRSSDI